MARIRRMVDMAYDADPRIGMGYFKLFVDQVSKFSVVNDWRFFSI